MTISDTEFRVVGDEQPWAHRASNPHQGNKLVRLHGDCAPVEPDHLLTPTSHRDLVRAVECAPAPAISRFDLKLRKRKLVGLEGASLESDEGRHLHITEGCVQAPQSDHATLADTGDPPACAAPAHGLSQLRHRTWPPRRHGGRSFCHGREVVRWRDRPSGRKSDGRFPQRNSR